MSLIPRSTQGENGFFSIITDSASKAAAAFAGTALQELPVWFGASQAQQTIDQLANPTFRDAPNNNKQNPTQPGLTATTQSAAQVVIPASGGVDYKKLMIPAAIVGGVVLLAVLLSRK